MKANSKKIVMRLDDETPKLGGSPMCIGEEPDADGSISPADKGKKPECAELRKNRNTWLKRKYKKGTWNVRSMASGKLNTIITEMRENKLDTLGISEHRWAG